MTDGERLEALRRRVLEDPASFAFGALAEEYRRLGRYADAVDVCRKGLQVHPGFLSARVILGRALIHLADPDGAAREFEAVLTSAPANLLARKGLSDVMRLRGDVAGALAQLRHAAMLAPQDQELPELIWALEQRLGHADQTSPTDPSEIFLPGFEPESPWIGTAPVANRSAGAQNHEPAARSPQPDRSPEPEARSPKSEAQRDSVAARQIQALDTWLAAIVSRGAKRLGSPNPVAG